MPRLHPRRRRTAWRVVTTLLLATFLGSSANSTMAMQTPASVDALLDKARGEENAGNYGAAENTYRKALAIAPENLEALKRMGVLEQTAFQKSSCG